MPTPSSTFTRNDSLVALKYIPGMSRMSTTSTTRSALATSDDANVVVVAGGSMSSPPSSSSSSSTSRRRRHRGKRLALNPQISMRSLPFALANANAPRHRTPKSTTSSSSNDVVDAPVVDATRLALLGTDPVPHVTTRTRTCGPNSSALLNTPYIAIDTFDHCEISSKDVSSSSSFFFASRAGVNHTTSNARSPLDAFARPSIASITLDAALIADVTCTHVPRLAFSRIIDARAEDVAFKNSPRDSHTDFIDVPPPTSSPRASSAPTHRAMASSHDARAYRTYRDDALARNNPFESTTSTSS
mmetsp:Transcript_4492/g.16429  ORF Transcript_4492/g.16429 Transcript_4492/m.16429 type:complete len:302 (+) Transcript_4492:1567-2472(+)